MPTTVVKTIRASGGDYTTLSAWEAAQQADLVTADEIRVAECYNDWPSGLSDAIDINGSTVDPTRYMKITVAAGHRHDGTPQSGFFITRTAAYAHTLKATDQYCRLEWLDVINTSAQGYAVSVASNGSVTSCIAKGGDISLGTAAGSVVIDTIIWGGVSGITFSNYAATYVYNTIASNCGTGFNGTANTDATLKNCVAYNCTTNYTGTFNAASTNNATSTGSDDAPGGSSVWGITSADFVDAANNDFHLASGSALIGAGVNLYATFTTDIDGDTWPSSGAWDIGADYYVASGGATNLIIAAALHAHTADSIALTLDTTLAIAESTHAHAADALDLTLDSTLAISESTHAHSADAPVLTTDSMLAIVDAVHAHLSDGVVLTSEHTLAIADALHAHLVDAPALSTEPSLAIAGADHAHSADSLGLTLDTTLVVADALHAHQADSVDLTTQLTLAILDSLHAHLAENLTLGGGDSASLVIAGSLHAHYADVLLLALVGSLEWPDPSGDGVAWPASVLGALAWTAPAGDGVAWP